MVKIIFCGNIPNGNWSLLKDRLRELQKSNHGPFDLLILTGLETFSTKDQYQEMVNEFIALEIKVYSFSKPDFINQFDLSESIEFMEDTNCGILNIHKNLTLAFYKSAFPEDLPLSVSQAISNLGYRGCDILISDKLPEHITNHLTPDEISEFKAFQIPESLFSNDVENFVKLLRPRYHFITNTSRFYQRRPYINQSTEGKPALYTRVITLDDVSTSKEKHKKWLHALSLNPIIYMKASEIEETPGDFTECPYGSSKRKLDEINPQQNYFAKQAKEMEFVPQGTGAFFFGSNANKSNRNMAPEGKDSTVLFIGGLGNEPVDNFLYQTLPNLINIKRAPGKPYAFLEFNSFDSAQYIMEKYGQKGLRYQQRTLNFGWSNKSNKQQAGNIPSFDEETNFKQRNESRLLVPPYEDAKTLYIGNVIVSSIEDKEALLALFPGSKYVEAQPGKNFCFVEFETYTSAMEIITKSIHSTIQFKDKALIIGWSKAKNAASAILTEAPTPESKVLYFGNLHDISTSDLDSFLQLFGQVSIRKPDGKDYAFIDFPSNDVACEAMNKLIENDLIINGTKIKIGWAKGKAADESNQSMDCWFCLASPSIKLHLIVSVAKYNYIALPRGGINDQHCLICPIDCVPNRLHLSSEAKTEMLQYVQSLDNMFLTNNSISLTFERSIRTKGNRDHMQIQSIPISQEYLSNISTCFTTLCDKYKLSFHQLKDEETLEDFVLNYEGGPYQEYFYFELPTSLSHSTKDKYVYLHEDSTQSIFPMYLGFELVANVIKKPERSNWKNCLVSEAQEEELTLQFRDQFQSYDFSLSS